MGRLGDHTRFALGHDLALVTNRSAQSGLAVGSCTVACSALVAMHARCCLAGQYGQRPRPFQYFLIRGHLECADDPVRVRIVSGLILEPLCLLTVAIPRRLLEPLLFSLFI